MFLNCMCLTTQGQTINTMLFVFPVKNVEPSEQSSNRLSSNENKQCDTVETDPNSHSEIVERV